MKYFVIAGVVAALMVWNYKRHVGKTVRLTADPYEIKVQELCFGEDGSRIYGRLWLPEGKEGKLPTVICSHGLNSSYRATEYMIGKSLAMAGFAVYCYDFCGGSPRSKSQGDPADMSVFTEQDDLNMVMDHIRTLPMVDTDRLFLMGESQGGFVSAITADQRSDEIKAMVLYYPAFCIPEDARNRYPNLEAIPEKTKRRANMMGRAYHEKLFDYDVYAHIAGFRKPVLILHGDRDPVVKMPYVERAASVYPNAQLKILRNQSHGFTPKGVQTAAHMVYDFLRKQMEG